MKEMMKEVYERSLIGVKRLSERYNFDYEEGIKYLNLNKEEKEKEKEKKEKIILPFCNKIIEGECHGIKLNYGLYTQCSNKITSKKEINGCNVNLCKICLKQCDKTENGKPIYGLIQDRLKVDSLSYRDPKGKQVIPYGNVMEKLNISREEAERAAKEEGLIIPEEQFEVKKGKRGRPKKDTSTEDTTSESSSVVEPKKRGRPKKSKEVVSTLNTGEDLIATLVAKAKEETSNSIEKVNKNEETEDEKEEEEKEEEEEDSDSEEITVRKFTHNGKEYLKATDDVIYDIETHDPIGTWNTTKNEIIFINTDSD